jgi:hypothetical protein
MEQGLMKSSRRIVLAFSGILALTAVVHTNMMPVSQEKLNCVNLLEDSAYLNKG